MDGEQSQAESPDARSNTCDTNDPIYVGGYPGRIASHTFIKYAFQIVISVCVLVCMFLFSPVSWSSSGGSLHQCILQRLSEEPENHQGFQDHGRALQQGSGDQRSPASLLSCCSCLTLTTKPPVMRISVFQCNVHTSSYIYLFEVCNTHTWEQKSALSISHRVCLHTTVKIMHITEALTLNRDSHNSLDTVTKINYVNIYKHLHDLSKSSMLQLS